MRARAMRSIASLTARRRATLWKSGRLVLNRSIRSVSCGSRKNCCLPRAAAGLLRPWGAGGGGEPGVVGGGRAVGGVAGGARLDLRDAFPLGDADRQLDAAQVVGAASVVVRVSPQHHTLPGGVGGDVVRPG